MKSGKGRASGAMEEPLISFNHIRKSTMRINEVYFWIDTVYKWKHLLSPDKYKEVIINSLRELSAKRLIYPFLRKEKMILDF